MKSNINRSSYHIARRVGQQGARCSVGDQADNDKQATGRTRKYLQLRNKCNIGTWNVRKLKELDKLKIICKEMSNYKIQILGIISETNWNGSGSIKTAGGNQLVIFSGKEEYYSHGVAVILGKEEAKALIGYSPINDRF